MTEVMKRRNKGAGGIKGRSQTLFVVLALAIPTVSWFVFFLYVNLSSYMLAFQNQKGEWSLINFQYFWNQLRSPYGDTIGRAILNTLKYGAVSVFVVLPLSVVIAYFIYKKLLCYKFFRIMFFFPTIITGIILVNVYMMMLSPNGLWDMILHIFNASVPEQGYFNYNPNNLNSATNAILLFTIWVGFGTNVVLIGSAMARVNESILEAAYLDGCGPFREVVQIILPLIWPTLSTLVLLSFTGFLNAGGPILLFGAPQGSTTLSYWIFNMMYGGGEIGQTGAAQNYGIVSATGLVFSVLWVPVVLLARWLMDKVPSVEY